MGKLAVQMPSMDSRWDYRPRRPAGFSPELIVLAKGSLDTPRRRAMADAIRALYPEARLVERLDTPHNRIAPDPGAALVCHYWGKRTLVLGVHGSAVRFSQEAGNACPNYWHISPYGFCPYDCTYCYLAATRGVRFSPTVKIFGNLDEMLRQVDNVASRLGGPTAFYLGKLQDGLALDPLTGYSRVMVPFFADHPHARLTLLTKSADVVNLLDLEHGGHTTVSWSLNPPAVSDAYERNVPDPLARIRAMGRCSRAGYPVRAVIMPIIPVPGWREIYSTFLVDLVSRVDLYRITLGGICSYPGAVGLMEAKLGEDNDVSAAIARGADQADDGRLRYPPADRIEIYRHLIAAIRSRRPDLHIGLCLESPAVFKALDMTSQIGRCNCVL